MSVAYGASIFVPCVCAVYTCECGRRSVRHGSRCGARPAGWQERGQGRHLCKSCAQPHKHSSPR